MYAMKHLLFDRYDLIRTNLPKTHYHDIPEIMLYGLMNLIVRFVEEEKCFETIDFKNGQSWEEAGEIIKEVYEWWKDYPNRQKELEISLNNWSIIVGENDNLLDNLTKNSHMFETPEAKHYSDIYHYLQDKLQKEENEMTAKVVKIREFLWT